MIEHIYLGIALFTLAAGGIIMSMVWGGDKVEMVEKFKDRDLSLADRILLVDLLRKDGSKYALDLAEKISHWNLVQCRPFHTPPIL